MDRKDGSNLAELMHELGKLEGLHWMRILYAYPSYFTVRCGLWALPVGRTVWACEGGEFFEWVLRSIESAAGG